MSRTDVVDRQMLEFIAGYIREYERPPTYQDIADAMGYTHRAAVLWRLRRLRSAGIVDWVPHTTRSLTIVQEAK